MAEATPSEPRPEHIERTEALRQEREELQRIVDLIPQTIIVLNPNGKAIYANRVALEYTGLSLDEVQADDFRDRVFHPEDVQRFREGRRTSLSGAVPFENEQRALGKDGKYRWFLIRYTPFLDENGKLVRWYATGTDIEDGRRAQEALRNALDQIQKSEARLRQVIDTIPTMAWCNLPDGPNEFLNKRWHEYTGLSPEESQWLGLASCFPSGRPKGADGKMATSSWASGESGEIEARVRRHDRVYRWFLDSHGALSGRNRKNCKVVRNQHGHRDPQANRNKAAGRRARTSPDHRRDSADHRRPRSRRHVRFMPIKRRSTIPDFNGRCCCSRVFASESSIRTISRGCANIESLLSRGEPRLN